MHGEGELCLPCSRGSAGKHSCGVTHVWLPPEWVERTWAH
jgi:hypothetical protein